MTQTPTPQPDESQTIIGHARKAGVKFAHALAANAARWVIGWSLGFVALYLLLALLTLVASSLIPTVLTLALGLLMGASAVVALVPERLREPRRGLRIAILGLLA